MKAESDSKAQGGKGEKDEGVPKFNSPVGRQEAEKCMLQKNILPKLL